MIENIKKLRELTNLAMSDCKKALEQSNNNIDLALEYLQKQGYKYKENVVSGEGIIVTAIGGEPLGKWASILEMNCQTDFVAKNEKFINTANNYLLHDLKFSNVNIVHINDEYGDINLPYLDENLSKIFGEQCILLRAKQIIANKDQFCQTYTHHNKKIGVIIVMNGFTENPLFKPSEKIMDGCNYFIDDVLHPSIKKFSEELCLHIAGANPKYLTINDIPVEILAKQKSIFEAQVRNDPKLSKKPDVTKIIDGKMNKWFNEIVLLKQESILHPKKIIEQLLQELSNEVDFDVKIEQFVRWEVKDNSKLTNQFNCCYGCNK